MKVFFGGSLPGLEANKEDYLKIRDAIVSGGAKLTRDWIEEEISRKTELTQGEMYELTEKAIKQADAVVLEYSDNISSGGQQLVLSLQRNIPILLLIRDGDNIEDSPLSDYFISPKYHKYLKKEKYNKLSIKKIISEFLVWVKNNKKVVRFNLEIEKDLNDYLQDKADKNKSSKSEEIRKLILEDINNKEANN